MGCIALLMVAAPYLNLWVFTQFEVARIAALDGKRGSFVSLTAKIHTRYRPVIDAEELERARGRLELSSLSNLYVVRFNGEGLPYFYGWVAYDTGQQRVVRAVVDQLW